jgi:hypothetical protein
MSRAGWADNSHSSRQGVANHGSGSPDFSRAAFIMNVNHGNQHRHGQFASTQSQIAEAILDIGAVSAGRVRRFAAAGRGNAAFELTHLLGPYEATPTL